MSGQKPQQPRVEWGFYAMVPRIVRTKYHDLSHAEKWLYTCLKDLCGDKGSCFRSLRSLSEETDISIASLSKMVPNLHQAGLIHAEKKRRSESGKEIWHISIVDIWQLNAKYCRDCSKNKQSQDAQTEIVQNPNEVVQKINDVTGDCSESERGCSEFSDRRITLKNNLNEEYDSEEEGKERIAFASASPSPSFSKTLVSHPEHNFIWFDDLLTPSIMVIRWTPAWPSRYSSEQEDERRGWIADAVEAQLEAKGLKIATRTEHETEQEVEQVLAENENKTQPTGETSEVHRLTSPIDPSDKKIVDADEVPGKKDTGTQERATSDEVIETQENALTTSKEQDEANIRIADKAEAKQSGRGRGGKKVTKPDLSPIAPPARPDSEVPFNAEKILAWGDYGRRMKLPDSPRRDSRAGKAREAARIIEGFNIPENLFLTLYFNWMKGVSLDLTELPEGALKSETWPDYPVDLWVFAEHFEEEFKRYRRKKAEAAKAAEKLPRPQSVSGLRNYTYEKGDPTPPPSALPFEIAPQSSPEPLVKPGEQPTTRKKLFIKRPARNIS